MKTIQKGTIALLKSAVSQRECALPQNFDLEAAYPLLKRHHMDALLYEGAMLCGIPKDLPVMKLLLSNYCRSLMASEAQMREVNRIFDAFEENSIDYMPLKGCKMKALYPKPELRTMGDADILIRMEQYERIVPVMESLGFAEGDQWDHELKWTKKALLIELHKRIVPEGNRDHYAYFGDGWQLAALQNGNRFEMRPEDEMVFLLAHFAKHYRAGGIGCRHVLDLWVFRKHHPNMDENYIKENLEKIYLRAFYENICKLMDVWFEDAPADEKSDFITDFIFDSGSWGRQETKIASSGVKDLKGKRGYHARWAYLVRNLLPGVDAVKDKFPFLQKAPWLLPLVWIYRPFYKILNKQARSTIKNHKTQLRNLRPDLVRTRQEALQYVGLDYHF